MALPIDTNDADSTDPITSVVKGSTGVAQNTSCSSHSLPLSFVFMINPFVMLNSLRSLLSCFESVHEGWRKESELWTEKGEVGGLLWRLTDHYLRILMAEENEVA